MAPLFPDFRKIRKRMKRSLNYGSKPPSQLNFPLSELVVEYFDKKCTFDYMEPETSTSISKRGFADPCSLVVALVYLDRLRLQNKEFFDTTDPTALYIPALVLASKYLHDADTYDRVSNSEWAESLNMNADDLNSMEWKFVEKIDWNVNVKNEDFENYLVSVEKWVATSFVKKNEFTTYNELLQLSSTIPIFDLIKQLIEVLSTASFIYCLTLALMTSTVHQMCTPSVDLAEQQPTKNSTHIYNDSPSSWLNDKEIKLTLNFDENPSDNNDSTPDICPTSKLPEKIEPFHASIPQIFSCYRPSFGIVTK